jgi:hypothetical protein
MDGCIDIKKCQFKLNLRIFLRKDDTRKPRQLDSATDSLKQCQAGSHKEISPILADQNSALVYEPKNAWGGPGGVAGSQPMSSPVHMEPK